MSAHKKISLRMRVMMSFLILLGSFIRAEDLTNLKIEEVSAETEIVDGEHKNCKIEDLNLESLKFKFNCGIEPGSKRLECWSECSSENNEIKIGFQCDCHVSIGKSSLTVIRHLVSNQPGFIWGTLSRRSYFCTTKCL